MGPVGEVLRTSSAMGFKAMIVVNWSQKKKISTFGAKGAESFMKQLHYSSWEKVKDDFQPTHDFIGISARALGEEEGNSMAVENSTLPSRDGIIFVIGCGKKPVDDDGTFLTEAQRHACNSFVHVTFPNESLSARVRYVLKASIVMERFAALRSNTSDSPGGGEREFEGEKFVLGTRERRSDRVEQRG